MRGLIRGFTRPLCLLLVCSLVVLDLTAQSARAGIVGTEMIIAVQMQDEARDRVAAFFQRQDVEAAMIAQGVSPVEARARVASLADEEIMQIARVLDRLPAGGDTAGVIGAILFVLVVLVITDIIGVTNIFPFVHPAR